MHKFNLQPSKGKAPLSIPNFLLKGAAYPAKVYREYKIPADTWGMYGNDSVGDCICAMWAHFLMNVTAHTGKMFIPDPQEVLKMYSAISGYVPGDPSTDQGTTIEALMTYMMTTGLQGHKILAWADLGSLDIEPQKQGVYIFGGTLDAVQFPQSAEDQFNLGLAWSPLDDDGGILGGHGVPKLGYGSDGYTINTWEKLQQVLWTWMQKYLMETAVAITEDWLNNADGLAPNTMNLDALNAALAAMK